MLEANAARENRGFTNMLETLLFGHCNSLGIKGAADMEKEVKGGTRG